MTACTEEQLRTQTAETDTDVTLDPHPHPTSSPALHILQSVLPVKPREDFFPPPPYERCRQWQCHTEIFVSPVNMSQAIHLFIMVYVKEPPPVCSLMCLLLSSQWHLEVSFTKKFMSSIGFQSESTICLLVTV